MKTFRKELRTPSFKSYGLSREGLEALSDSRRLIAWGISQIS